MLPGPAFFVYAVCKHAWENLGSLDYSLGSLVLWVVRRIIPGFVGFMGSSLDYSSSSYWYTGYDTIAVYFFAFLP